MSPLTVVATAMLGASGLAVGLGLLTARWVFRRTLAVVLKRAHEEGRCPICEQPVQHANGDVH